MRAPRRASGRRVFDDDAVAELTVITLAKQAGFTLGEVRQLVNDFPISRWKELAERKLREIEETSASLQRMTVLLQRLLQCNCFDLDACGRALREHGCVEGDRTES